MPRRPVSRGHWQLLRLWFGNIAANLATGSLERWKQGVKQCRLARTMWPDDLAAPTVLLKFGHETCRVRWAATIRLAAKTEGDGTGLNGGGGERVLVGE